MIDSDLMDDMLGPSFDRVPAHGYGMQDPISDGSDCQRKLHLKIRGAWHAHAYLLLRNHSPLLKVSPIARRASSFPGGRGQRSLDLVKSCMALSSLNKTEPARRVRYDMAIFANPRV
jgi:hypothetical protein